MKIKVVKTIGKNELTFETDEPNFDKAMSEIVPFTQPDYCQLCKSEDVMFDINKGTSDKGTFTYIKRKCNKCGAQSTLGKYKDGGYFWKPFEIWEGGKGKTNNASEAAIPIGDDSPPIEEDQLPF